MIQVFESLVFRSRQYKCFVVSFSCCLCATSVIKTIFLNDDKPTKDRRQVTWCPKFRFMLTLVFGKYVSEAIMNRSLDLGLIAIETRVYGHKFVFIHVLYYEIQYKIWSKRLCSFKRLSNSLLTTTSLAQVYGYPM